MNDETRKYLQSLAISVDRVMRDELERSGIKYDFAEARILNLRTVGVQGDDRTYDYPAEISITSGGSIVWRPDFAEKLSSRITNEVRGINRVVYVMATRE